MADNDLLKQPARGSGRRFEKGHSGNPAGRPPGRRNDATLAAESLLEGEAEALTRMAIERAQQGDPIALKLCLERILPRRRERPITVDLPPVNSAADLAPAATAILRAIAAGNLTPCEAQAVLAVYGGARSIFETTTLEARVKALEEGFHS
jgi:Family of unknown function (DUF5681)